MDVAGLANMLVGCHAMAAVATKMPELQITEDEAKRLAVPILELQKYYKVPFDPKWAAWFQLVTAAGAVYMPRILYMSKKAQLAKMSPKPTPPKNPTDGLVTEPDPVDIPVPEETAPPPGFKLNLGGV